MKTIVNILRLAYPHNNKFIKLFYTVGVIKSNQINVTTGRVTVILKESIPNSQCDILNS